MTSPAQVATTQPAGSPFWAAELDRLTEAHIAPISALVDDLAAERPHVAVPYVAPHHGGTGARILSVLADPGRKAIATGMLSILNPDQTAKAQLERTRSHGIELADITPWNAFPWQHPAGAPTPADVRGAVHALHRLVHLLPDVRVVLLQGGAAHQAWDDLLVEHPEHAVRPLAVLRTLHPGAQALQTADVAERARRVRHRERTWATAAWLIGRGERPT